MACLIYARQSDTNNSKRATEDGETLSIEAQLHACRAHAAGRGWPVAAEYHEQFSGLADQRPEYQRMLTEIKRSHQVHSPGHPARITHLVIYKWARLSRDPNTVVPLVAMFRRMGIEVELEHTNSRVLSKQIAKAHLSEMPDYYTQLKKMEERSGVSSNPGKKLKVQSVRFDRDKFTHEEAKKWLLSHGYKRTGVDITENELRYRQGEPEDFRKGTYLTFSMKDRKGNLRGIRLLRAIPK